MARVLSRLLIYGTQTWRNTQAGGGKKFLPQVVKEFDLKKNSSEQEQNCAKNEFSRSVDFEFSSEKVDLELVKEFLNYLERKRKPELIPLAVSFIKSANITPEEFDFKKWFFGLLYLHQKGANPDDVRKAVALLQKGGMAIVSPHSIRNVVNVVLAEKISTRY